jgi:hypothetical protein
MMPLKQFVAETIAQIVEGVVEAQERVSKLKGTVNPTKGVRLGQKFQEEHCASEDSEGYILGNVVQTVSFDVAVTAEEGQGTEAGAGVRVALFTLGAAGHSDSKSSSASRVQFTVPLLLPPGDD